MMSDNKLTTNGDDQIDSKSMQHLTHDPSARSVFQVAYYQKSGGDKQGGANELYRRPNSGLRAGANIGSNSNL